MLNNLLLLAVGLGFLLLGSTTGQNDIFISSLREVFQLSYSQAVFFQSLYFIVFLFFALPLYRLVSGEGFTKTLVIGGVVLMVGYLVNTLGLQSQSLVLVGGGFLLTALGVVFWQIALNPLLSFLADKRGGVALFTLFQGFYSVGSTVAPLVLGRQVYEPLQSAPVSSLAEVFANAYLPLHMFLIVIVLGVSLIFWITRGEIKSLDANLETYQKGLRQFLRDEPYSLWGMLGIFFYIGAEVGVAVFLIPLEKEIVASSFWQGAKLVSLYWGGLLAGRFIAPLYMQKFSEKNIFISHLGLSLLVLLGTVFGFQMTAVVFILGFGHSVFFPLVFSATLSRVRKEPRYMSALLCMAISGGALMPYSQSLIADFATVQFSYLWVLLCYVGLGLSYKKLIG
jgi:FHS family L-fucose permease-like MFS transporter